MPKSFLIKRVHTVNTGYFPWNKETLVQGCCLEYEEEESETEASEQSMDTNSENDTPYQCLSEIKILTPYYASSMSPPRLILSTCCDSEDERCSVAGENDIIMIPSPSGRDTPPLVCDCDICHSRHKSNFYITPPTVKRHLSWKEVSYKNDVKKHQCEFCLKCFERSSSLSNHRLIHKNAKTFKCNQCNMSFLRKSDLGKHMVTHSGIKPFQCNVCGKRFSQSSNMLTHQRRHTGIRPYSCEVCGKSFYRKVDVRRHMSVHRIY